MSPHAQLATEVASAVLAGTSRLRIDPGDPRRVQMHNALGEQVSVALEPVRAEIKPPTARHYFAGVETPAELFGAYREASRALPFEMDLPEARRRVHPYATEFLRGLFDEARTGLEDRDAARIARWVQDFDIYVAVKAVESLLNSKADLALLQIAEARGWCVHFDHLAIRCGSEETGDAERVAGLLTGEHGYVGSQVPGEKLYRFADGWSAYLLYKMLDNGQVLRLFIDQSDAGHPTQIIQHWNHVYGYTAHHLAIRATRPPLSNVGQLGARVAVTLEELCDALAEHGIGVMEATGHYTEGLLLQVFTRPERTPCIPPAITEGLGRLGAGLETKIRNGKLLELVARREMPPELAERFFQLYGLPYTPENPLHSAPIYPYFLPEQAAHVIRTSLCT
ncbi:MAG: hypothetical protein M3495_15270 [Pseudomonadota bacterium]|nr:hypothetical protein [Gammaproteobacteria bacterium]MDQ3582871.1 hypothetical protein [Pseudomonadota bacterium]